MRCTILPTETGWLVTVAGEVDMATAPELAETLSECASGSVTVNLAEVTFMDSSGVTALLMATERLERRGCTLTLQSVRPDIWRVLELCGVDTVLTIERFHGGRASTLRHRSKTRTGY
jgi:anti-sigma B factor antagonist